MSSPSGRAQRPNIALMFSDKWFVYWGNWNFLYRSPFCWGIFLSIPSFAHKKIIDIHLFFDFVKTHLSNDCIGCFSTFKHILKGHVGLWSELGDFYLVFLKLSCVMWMLESLESRFWSCTVERALVLLDLLCAIFFLLFNMAKVANWNLGGFVGQDAK